MSNHQNRWVRLDKNHETFHLNEHFPDAPDHGATKCGLVTTTPVYESEMKGVGGPQSFARHCVYCDNPDMKRAQ